MIGRRRHSRAELQHIESLLLELIDQFGSEFPRAQTEGVPTLVSAGEWGVALECLCTQLYEYDVTTDADTV